MQIEQRKFPRVNTTLDTIYFMEDSYRERMHYPGKLINVSKGGAGIIAFYPHNLHDKIWLEGIDESSLPVSGRIQWINEANEANEKFTMGIKFI